MAEPLQRFDYAFSLEVLSPLHIGEGGYRDDLLPPRTEDGQVRTVKVKSIQRDLHGKPWIPGSSLKGLLRSIATTLALPEKEVLLGTAKADGSGRIGALHVRGASMTKPGTTDGLPYASEGVFVAARSAIDPGRGIAAPNKLFHAEMVAAGALFNIRLRLEARGNVGELDRDLKQVIAALSVSGGLALGADKSTGQGRMRLAGRILVTPWRAGINGLLEAQVSKEVTFIPPKVPEASSLRLHCAGPYIARDPSWTADVRRKQQDKTDGFVPHLRPLQHGGTPMITGTSVAGALRARFEWIDAVGRVKRGEEPTQRTDMVNSLSALGRLSACERLFGTTGFRGVLTVQVHDVSAAKKAVQMTLARMDRFAGGTIDAALFGIEADLDVAFSLALRLDHRATGEDRAALNSLVGDLKANGLRLGHGTTRGFGWFQEVLP